MIVDKSALEHIIKCKPHDHVALRVAIEAGGCSGFNKIMEWCNHINPDDVIIQDHVVMDPQSAEILTHATLTYMSDLSGSKLVIKIPEATTECGCGVSFNF